MGINCKGTWEHKERGERGLISRKGPALGGGGEFCGPETMEIMAKRAQHGPLVEQHPGDE